MNIFLVSYSQSDMFGKLIMLGLIALSAIAWIVLLYKAWVLRIVKKNNAVLMKHVRRHEGAVLTLSVTPPPHHHMPQPGYHIFSVVREKALEVLNKNRQLLPGSEIVHLATADIKLLENYGLSVLSEEHKGLERHLFILSTIVTLAPFLGLLGTVWGILVTFGGLQGGGSISNSASIVGGLSTALATTVLGLVIAIPALIAYNYLKNRVKELSVDMGNFLSEILAQVELQYRKAE